MTDRADAPLSGRDAGLPASEGLPGLSFVWKRLPVLLLVILLVLGTLVPLFFVIVGSFRPSGLATDSGWTLAHYVGVWGNPYTYRLLANTLVFTIGSTAIGVSLALVLAWLLERTDIPGSRIFRSSLVLPMVFPPLLLAMGWVLMMSPRIGLITSAVGAIFGRTPDWLDIYSILGMTVVLGLAYVPTAFLIFAPVMRNMDPAFEEASRMSSASGFQTIRRISMPFLFPSIVSTATLFFIIGMLSFDIPAVIGMAARIDVMSIEVFRLLNPESGSPDYGAAAAMNSVLIVVLFLFLGLYARMLRNSKRYVTVSGKAFRATRFRLGRWKAPSVIFVAAYFLLGIVLPTLAMLWVSLIPYLSGFRVDLMDDLSFDAYGIVLQSRRFWDGLANASIVALTASVGSLAVSLAIARVALGRRGTLSRLVAPLAMLPLGIPHLMLGMALVFMMLNANFTALYGTLWIIAIGHVIGYLPITSRMMQLGLMQLGNELEEVAMTSGASTLQRLRDIIVPLLQPTFIAIFLWMFIHSIREFSLAMMLQSGRNEVLSTVLYGYWNTAAPNVAAAMAILLMTALALFTLIFGLVFRRRSSFG